MEENKERVINDPDLESQNLLNMLLGVRGSGFGSFGFSPMMGMFFSMLMGPSLFGGVVPEVLMPKEKVDEIMGMEETEGLNISDTWDTRA